MSADRWQPRLLLGGLTALGAGMTLVTAGVRVASLFLPGVFVLGSGFVLLAAAGVAALATRPAPAAE